MEYISFIYALELRNAGGVCCIGVEVAGECTGNTYNDNFFVNYKCVTYSMVSVCNSCSIHPNKTHSHFPPSFYEREIALLGGGRLNVRRWEIKM